MGSLKDEMRGLREDHKPGEKAGDGERPGASDGSAAPEGPDSSQESTSRGDYQPKLNTNASYTEERESDPISKDQVLSGGVCDNSHRSDSQPEADKTAARSDATISNKLSERDTEIQRETKKENTGLETEKEAEIQTISVAVPLTPGLSDPVSPAPFGQHHMRTQVSLEVVQCRSAATSPMTPPEDGHSFFFPSSFGKSGAVGTDTKDAELQVGQQVEFCSVATSPMTPKTPFSTAFPELIGRETEEKVKQSEGQRGSNQGESFTATESPAGAESEISATLKCTTSEEMSENASSESCPAVGLRDAQVTLEDTNQQCKQQRMGSMDQDITILVTQYGSNGDEEEDDAESSLHPIAQEMVKIDEYEEPRESKSDGNESVFTETDAPDHEQDTANTNPPQIKADNSNTDVECENSEVKENKGACETKPQVPESPAPFGCHSIRTQVSLEVVQCQSVATSPMTPPEGDQAFCFPSSLGRCGAVTAETKDVELQVGQQVEFRSVATAPMTPRTPTTTTFPEITKEASIEEKIVEEEEDQKEQVVGEEKVKEEEKVTDEEKVEATEEDDNEATNCKEKCEEPVQEVSWDEKGMTWEVYGAVVEVTVLGSAIQKHLEKQVKKQKRQSSMPPPPPLNPSAMPLSAESAQGGSGKSRTRKKGERDGEVSRHRRNPFRQLMENMQQPHCCSRAHTSE